MASPLNSSTSRLSKKELGAREVPQAATTPRGFSTQSCQRTNSKPASATHVGTQRTLNRRKLAQICPDTVSRWPVQHKTPRITHKRGDQKGLDTIQHCLWLHPSLSYHNPVPSLSFPVSLIDICLEEPVIPIKGNDS